MSGWRPIESAPRDGTDVLVWDGEDVWISHHILTERFEHGKLVSRTEGWARPWPQSMFDSGQPTHWMPLPPPPGGGTEQMSARQRNIKRAEAAGESAQEHRTTGGRNGL